MTKSTLISALFLGFSAPALAQFPPPGIYACVNGAGDAVGTLSLFVAGDYDFTGKDMASGPGQIASAGNSVNALSGPLADLHLKGSFSSNERGEAVFIFATDKGAWQCGLPPY